MSTLEIHIGIFNINFDSSCEEFGELIHTSIGKKILKLSKNNIDQIINKKREELQVHGVISLKSIRLSIHEDDKIDIIEIGDLRFVEIVNKGIYNSKPYEITFQDDYNREPICLLFKNIYINSSIKFFYDTDFAHFEKCKIDNLTMYKDDKFELTEKAEIDNRYNNLSMSVPSNPSRQVVIAKSSVENLSFIKSFEDIVISDSTIEKITVINFKNIELSANEYRIKSFEIYDSEIKEFGIYSDISSCTMIGSSFSNIYIEECKINELSFKNSFLRKSIRCNEENFGTINVDVAELLLRHEYLFGTEKTITEKKYQLEKTRSKNMNYFSNKFLDYSMGYGYKPSRAIWFIIVSVVIFTFLYLFIDVVTYLFQYGVPSINNQNLIVFISKFLDRFYYSCITFATIGYGDQGDKNIIIWVLSFIEACLGVSTLSLFIYALTKKNLK